MEEEEFAFELMAWLARFAEVRVEGGWRKPRVGRIQVQGGIRKLTMVVIIYVILDMVSLYIWLLLYMLLYHDCHLELQTCL